MAGNETRLRYDPLAIAIHWVVAAAILVALPLGFLAAHTADHQRGAALLRIHVPLGIMILFLTVARAVWRYRRGAPPPLAGQPRWRVGVARVSHALLYVVPIVMGVSGLALVALSGAAPILFSRVPGVLPDFSRFPPMKAHAIGAFAVIGLISLHVAAVVHHQLFRRDRLLARMGIGSPPGTAR